MADELIGLDDSLGLQMHTFQTQIKSLLDDVKKGEEELKMKGAGLERDLESLKKSAAEKSDEVLALKLRINQIEEFIRAEEQVKKREAELKSEEVMAKIRERKEKAKASAEVQKGKSASASVLVPAANVLVLSKATGKRPLEKSAEHIKIE